MFTRYQGNAKKRNGDFNHSEATLKAGRGNALFLYLVTGCAQWLYTVPGPEGGRLAPSVPLTETWRQE